MKLKYTFELMELDDEIVAIPCGVNASEFNGIVKLNESAAVIFNLLKEETSEEEIVEKLLMEYNIDKLDLEKFVHNFVEKLKIEGALE